jgi:5-methylthioadenosine/S-adenosylhomocysteine deaminase
MLDEVYRHGQHYTTASGGDGGDGGHGRRSTRKHEDTEQHRSTIGALMHGRLLLVLVSGAFVAAQSTPRQVSLLITNGIVVTMDGGSRVLTPGAVAVDGRDIVAVGPSPQIVSAYRAADTIDADGDVVMPGLINTHTHAPMVLYRGLADDLALMDWLQNYIFPAEAKTVNAAFVRAGTRLAALEMIRSGTTAYVDMYYFEEEIGRATKAAGLRGILGQTIIQFPVPDAKTPAEGLARTERFIREFAKDDLIVPAVAPHSMYTLDAGTLKAARQMADRERVPLVIHLAETVDEVKIARDRHSTTPVGYLGALGVLGSRTIAAHGVHLTPGDIAMLKQRGVGVSHNPESNMKLASGTAPVPALRAAGVPVGLGTDGAASNNDLDMFEAMRQAALLHKLQSNDPRTLPAPEVLAMATAEGARVIGMERELGSLEPGKRADMIVVSMRSARQTPMYDPISHLVYVTRGDDVRTTIVNGRILMRDRKVLTMDEGMVLNDARRLAAQVRVAVGK